MSSTRHTFSGGLLKGPRAEEYEPCEIDWGQHWQSCLAKQHHHKAKGPQLSLVVPWWAQQNSVTRTATIDTWHLTWSFLLPLLCTMRMFGVVRTWGRYGCFSLMASSCSKSLILVCSCTRHGIGSTGERYSRALRMGHHHDTFSSVSKKWPRYGLNLTDSIVKYENWLNCWIVIGIEWITSKSGGVLVV